MTNPKKRIAFSLTELLIVLGITSLLMALAIFSGAKAHSSSSKIVCTENLGIIQTVVNGTSTNRGEALPYRDPSAPFPYKLACPMNGVYDYQSVTCSVHGGLNDGGSASNAIWKSKRGY